MSVIFECGLSVKTFGDGTVHIWDDDGAFVKIPMDVFFDMCKYALANTDLRDDDPRPTFLRQCARMIETEGYNVGRVRLAFDGEEKT